MEQSLIKSSEEISSLFRKIHRSFREAMYQTSENFNFTVPQMMLLFELFNHPCITLNELSRKLGLAKSTVSGIVDRLEARGVVTRERPKENRRTVNISLTAEAMEKGDMFKDIKTQYIAKRLASLPQEDIDRIIIGLKLLNSVVKPETGK